MKVAIVNNGKNYPQRIVDLLGDTPVQVFSRSKIDSLEVEDSDLLILSGSSHDPIEYNKESLSGEMKLIRRSTIPTIGICYGCELIAVAFGGELKDLGGEHKKNNIISIEMKVQDNIFCGKKSFEVYDAHRWIIDKLPEKLKLLACSKHGPEVIKHKELPMYGFQFHPEKMIDETYGDEIFNNFIKQYIQRF